MPPKGIIYHRVLALGCLVSLKSKGAWSDYNCVKGEFLLQGLQSFRFSGQRGTPILREVVPPLPTRLNLIDFPDPQAPALIDCVSNLTHKAFRKSASIPQPNVGSSSFDFLTSPDAFMTPSHHRKPVIFDTGASLAITPDKILMPPDNSKGRSLSW
jgi:hypothetical protein